MSTAYDEPAASVSQCRPVDGVHPQSRPSSIAKLKPLVSLVPNDGIDRLLFQLNCMAKARRYGLRKPVHGGGDDGGGVDHKEKAWLVEEDRQSDKIATYFRPSRVAVLSTSFRSGRRGTILFLCLLGFLKWWYS